MAFLRPFVVGSMLVAALAASPVFAQKPSLAERVARLEQQEASQANAAGQANVELLNRVTQMQAEVQALRNQVETLQNEIEQLRQRGREQYIDLDTRLQRMEAGGLSPAVGAPSPAGSPDAVGAPGAAGSPRVLAPAAGTPPRTTAALPPGSAGGSSPGMTGAGAMADEQGAYSTAFDSLRRSDYVESARGFQAFLRDYPQARLAPNAWYWLGESYYATQNFPLALQAFETLLSQFPDSGKAPDAMLKKGYCQIELGQDGQGRQSLNRVIGQFPGSDAARLATSRLRTLDIAR